MKISVEVHEGINVEPRYSAYRGDFSDVTRCIDCQAIGLYEDHTPANCCHYCGGKVSNFASGKWNASEGKWLIRN